MIEYLKTVTRPSKFRSHSVLLPNINRTPNGQMKIMDKPVALLGCYAVQVASCLLTFRHNL